MSCHTCPHIPCPNLYMMSGTVTKRKYFNIRAIYESLPAGSVSAILPFDALTGCDTTSFICNHSNSLDSIPKAPHNSFLTQRGRTNQSKKMKEVEKFAWRGPTYFVFQERKARATATDKWCFITTVYKVCPLSGKYMETRSLLGALSSRSWNLRVEDYRW